MRQLDCALASHTGDITYAVCNINNIETNQDNQKKGKGFIPFRLKEEEPVERQKGSFTFLLVLTQTAPVSARPRAVQTAHSH